MTNSKGLCLHSENTHRDHFKYIYTCVCVCVLAFTLCLADEDVHVYHFSDSILKDNMKEESLKIKPDVPSVNNCLWRLRGLSFLTSATGTARSNT